MVAMCILATTSLVAHQQTRDSTTRPPASGTARIAGIVVSADGSATPVRRVIVTLNGGELPGGRTAITDDEGRFSFDHLPAGRFTLIGTKAAYLQAAYGATMPGRPGLPLELIGGEHLTDIVLAIAHGGAIAGVLRDQRGDAVPSVQVTAFKSPLPGNAPTLVSAGATMTDDRGAYRIFGLAPGAYFIVSTIRLTSGAAQIDAISSTHMDAALRALQQRTVGQPKLDVPMAVAATPLTAPGAYAFAPVFFPGVTRATEAEQVTLALSEERVGVDFVARLTRVATIEGSVVSADGQVPRVQLIINPEGVALPSLMTSVPTFTTSPGATSQLFKYTSVAPGRYTITARSAASSAPLSPQGSSISSGVIGPPSAADRSTPILWARVDVDVAGDDISGLTLVLQPAMQLTGRVTFDGAVLPPPTDLSKLTIRLSVIGSLGSSAMNGTIMGSVLVPPAIVAADGHFEITGILPGAYRLSGTVAAPAGWWLRSAMVNGQDVLDVPLEVDSTGNLTNAVLTFSDRHASLGGQLLTASGQAAPAFVVVVFPADRSLWRPQARRIQSVRASTDGRWTIRDMPPGDYLVAAVTDLDPSDLLYGDFLAKLVSASVQVTLGDGEQKVQDLRIGGGGMLFLEPRRISLNSG
jgi:hypothetical protein